MSIKKSIFAASALAMAGLAACGNGNVQYPEQPVDGVRAEFIPHDKMEFASCTLDSEGKPEIYLTLPNQMPREIAQAGGIISQSTTQDHSQTIRYQILVNDRPVSEQITYTTFFNGATICSSSIMDGEFKRGNVPIETFLWTFTGNPAHLKFEYNQ
jgi:hypothetical protein